MSTRKSIGTRKYIGQRIAQTILIWFIIVTLNFVIFRIMPGDPRQALLGEGLSPDVRNSLVERFGLDRPLIEQYWLYIVNLFKGDLGVSFSHFNQPVMNVIFDFRFANTFILMGAAMFVAILIGLIFGVLAAARRDTIVDSGSTVIFLVAYALPVFWIGVLILYYFGFVVNLIPLAGTITRGLHHANFIEYLFDYLHHMIGPFIVLT
ncbi:MAG: ABC transporter permease, partial [Candidatus Thorarchaeota archaeon]|nr:ABC transporter permease [Candidatus Thorarchaeota archaeon]